MIIIASKRQFKCPKCNGSVMIYYLLRHIIGGKPFFQEQVSCKKCSYILKKYGDDLETLARIHKARAKAIRESNKMYTPGGF